LRSTDATPHRPTSPPQSVQPALYSRTRQRTTRPPDTRTQVRTIYSWSTRYKKHSLRMPSSYTSNGEGARRLWRSMMTKIALTKHHATEASACVNSLASRTKSSHR
jgi:hypothetical protein